VRKYTIIRDLALFQFIMTGIATCYIWCLFSWIYRGIWAWPILRFAQA